MKTVFSLALFVFVASTVNAQINYEENSAQTVSYWSKGDVQSYSITTTKYKLKDQDTTSKEVYTSDVDITILKETDESYTMEWRYYNIRTNQKDALTNKLMRISNDMKVIVKTDEMGAFEEVVNWKEIKNYIHKATMALREEYKNLSAMDMVLKQIEATYSSKEAIESVSIKDIQQFLTFHGGVYTKGEVVEGTLEVPNILGPKPFDAKFEVFLDEIDPEEESYTVIASQIVDEEQLTQATFDYLTAMAKNMNVEGPKRSDIQNLKNETLTLSRIHDSGWPLYSIQTITVTSDRSTGIEERTIELKD